MHSLFYGNAEENDDLSKNPSYSGTTNNNNSSNMFNVLGGGNNQNNNNSTVGSSLLSGYAQEVGIHVANASSVKEYAYTEDKNRAFRPDMEDTYCHSDKVAGDSACGVFGVFDGHGGKTCSEHCADVFVPEMRKELQKQPGELYQVLENVFLRIDKQLELMDSDHTGTTAVLGVVRRENNHNSMVLVE